MLSQVERGETSPTLTVAARIAAGLELRLSQLLRLDEGGAVTIVRAAERRRGGNARRGHRFEVLTSAAARPARRALAPHARARRRHRRARRPADARARQPRDRARRARLGRARLRRPAPRARARATASPSTPTCPTTSRTQATEREACLSLGGAVAPGLTDAAETMPQDAVRQDLGGARGRDRALADLHRPAPRARGHQPAGVRRAAARRPHGAPARPHARDRRPQHAHRRHARGGAHQGRALARAGADARAQLRGVRRSRSTRSAPTARASCT